RGVFAGVQGREGLCCSLCGLLERHAADLGGCVLNRLHNVLVARTAAQVARDAEANLILGRILVLLQQAISTRDHAGRTKTTLEAVHFTESFLQHVYPPPRSSPASPP